MVKNRKKPQIPSGAPKPATKAEFLIWCATPEQVRDPKTQKEFAARHEVNEATLSKWKNDPDFDDKRIALTKKWGREKMPAALAALYSGVIKSKRGADFKIFAQYAEDWVPKEDNGGGDGNEAVAAEIEKLRILLKGKITGAKAPKK